MKFLWNLIPKRLGTLVTALLALLPAAIGAQVQLLHPTNTVWRYQTDLVVQQAAGTDWVSPGFDDSAWPQGRGLFGNEANYPYPMNTTGAGLGAMLPMANYFRARFTWSGSTAGVTLRGTNYVDDGSIIYLNGVEIARFNMPATANAGTPEASAPTANPGGYPNVNGGEPVLVELQIDLSNLTNGNPNPLVQGDNVVAVQAHQQGTGSSDRVFGLALYGGHCEPPCFFSTTAPIQPTNRVILEGRSTTFSVVASCGFPSPTFQWYRDIGAGEELVSGATSTTYTLSNAIPSDSGVYYVKAVNSCGMVASRQATLTVFGGGDPPSLLSGRLNPNNNLEIIVTADEALCPDDSCAGNASLSFNYEIFEEGNQSNQLTIVGVVVNGNTLTFALDASTPWQIDTRYVIRLQLFGAGSIGDLYGNLLYGGDPGSSVTTPPAASAISVKAVTGSDLYTFDVAPSVLEFSTFTWAGTASYVTSTADLDAAVQSFDRSLFTSGLQSAPGNPPGGFGQARYASETKNLITRPSGVIGNVILAHLRNDSGSPAGMVTLNYTLTNREPNVREGIPGLRVYSSLNGASNTWNPVYVSPNEDATGSKTGIIDLRFSPWSARTDMYILFVDDNAPGFEVEGIYEIDNFRASIGHIDCLECIPPRLVRAVSRDSTTIVLTFSEPMATSAGSMAPYSVSGATVQSAALNPARNEVTLTTTARPVGHSIVTITGLRDASDEANLTDPNPISFRLTTVQKIVDWNTAWEYNTNNLDVTPTWKTTGGAGWQIGNGLFGTETSAGVVAIMPTPIATVIPPPNTNNEFMVSYFRKTVTLPALAAGQSYAIGHLIDDGAVFYLDGSEIGRVNMPAGPVGYATNAIAGAEGSLMALPFTATSGAHTLAVEVHQNVNTSSDIVFGASVLVVPTVSPTVSISVPYTTWFPPSTNVTVSWNADSSWALVGSSNVAGPYSPVRPTTANSLIRPVTTPSAQFYKLNYVPQP